MLKMDMLRVDVYVDTTDPFYSPVSVLSIAAV